MNNTPKGMVISSDKGLCRELASVLSPMVDIQGPVADIALGYRQARDAASELVFLDLGAGEKECMSFTRRMKRVQPDTQVLMVGAAKDPGLLLDAMRAGVSDFLFSPFNNAEISDAVQGALARGGDGSGGGEVVSVFSLKGGVGVTTIAMNLAGHLYDLTGDKVLLLDLNLFMGDVTSYLNMPMDYTPYDLLRDVDRMDEKLMFSLVNRHDSGIYVMAPPVGISDAEQVGPEDIAAMTAVVKRYFDYIIVDCPHEFSERTLMACSLSDKILVVAHQTIPAVKSTRQVMDFFNEMEFDRDKIEVVLNRYKKDSAMDAAALEGVLEKKIAARISSASPLFEKMTAGGKIVCRGDGKHPINREFRALAGRLTGIHPSPSGLLHRLGGMFR